MCPALADFGDWPQCRHHISMEEIDRIGDTKTPTVIVISETSTSTED